MQLRYKLIIFYFIAAIIPLLLATIFYDSVSHRTLKENVSSLSQEILNQKKENINDRTLAIEENIHMSVNNQEILRRISSLSNSSVIEATTETDFIRKYFNTILYNTRFLDTIIVDIYDDKPLTFGEGVGDGFVSERVKYLTSNEFKESAVYRQVQKKSYEADWYTYVNEDEDKLYLMKEIIYFQYAKKLGVIVYVIDKSMLTEGLTETISDRSEDYALIDKKNNHYILGGKHSKFLSQLQEVESSEKAITVSDSQNLVSYVNLINQWELISIVPEKSIFSNLIKTRQMTMLLVLIGVIFSFIAAWIISRLISQKVTNLIKRFEKVEKGDFSPQYDYDGRDEFGIIQTQFNSMVIQLDTVINENYLWEIETKEANLRALQYQINPHFLFNTLEVINSLASQNRQLEIRKVTQNLSKMFRYNLDSEQTLTTLSKEVNHVKIYLYLQQFQLTYDLQVVYDLQPEVENARIQKFMLQPIVENIIQHGFLDMTQEGYIEVQAQQVDEKLLIMIADDGNGIEPQRLATIREQLTRRPYNRQEIKEVAQMGIGLKNIQERIQLLYGNDYGLSVNSELGKGTQVLLEIPFQQEEEE